MCDRLHWHSSPSLFQRLFEDGIQLAGFALPEKQSAAKISFNCLPACTTGIGTQKMGLEPLLPARALALEPVCNCRGDPVRFESATLMPSNCSIAEHSAGKHQ